MKGKPSPALSKASDLTPQTHTSMGLFHRSQISLCVLGETLRKAFQYGNITPEKKEKTEMRENEARWNGDREEGVENKRKKIGDKYKKIGEIKDKMRKERAEIDDRWEREGKEETRKKEKREENEWIKRRDRHESKERKSGER